ncbi:MAG: DUF1876 family protein [Myxococcales bacterium]|jgi:hypothetical protein
MSGTKRFTVDVEVVEQGQVTDATARLAIGGEELVGMGKARRNPDDPDRPMIGDELAIARALVVLAKNLGEKVDKGIGAYEGHVVHITI